MTVYSETCINWSCPKAETLLGRAGTFNPVCFLYASLSRISKAETVKKTLFQTDSFFQPSDKKGDLPYANTNKSFRISEKRRISFEIFVIFLKKKRFFYTLKQFFCFDFILQFLKESDTSEYNTAY